MKKRFARVKRDQDFSKYFGEIPSTRKQRLLEECRKNGVSIYIDKPLEQSSCFYAELRGVASDAELDRRLNEKKAVSQASRANVISAIAIIISLVALVKSFL
jgi:hypothetical protein